MSYQFKLEPYQHQRDTLNRCWDKENFALFMDMGTGKTKVLLDNAGILYEKGLIDGLLVIAPKGVYNNWTLLEIPKHLPERIPSRCRSWRSGAGKKESDSIREILVPRGDERGLDILVMNVDAVNTKKGFAVAEEFLKNHSTLMAVDESTTIKNIKAKRTQKCIELGRRAEYRRILTGSPITKDPLDLYGQCAFLDPRLLGHRSYFTFRNEFAVMQKKFLGYYTKVINGQPVQKKREVDVVVGFRNQDRLSKRLEEFSVRYMKEDCLDLPEKQYQVREVPLTKEQRRIYDSLTKECLAELDGELVTAPHILTRMLRLQQVVCGYVQIDDDEETTQVESNRVDVLMDVVEETSSKVIIWARFKDDIRTIRAALAAKYGEESVATYDGDTKDSERQEIITRFEDPNSELRFFVGNAATGGFGITLLQGRTVIYYSNSFSLEHRLQSEDRSHRAGQTQSVTYVDLVSPDTIDEKVVKALKSKYDVAASILGDDTDYRKWFT